jgi:ATP-dependent RNA helicase RhlE
LVSADEFNLLQDIEKLLNQKIERVEINGFEPEHVMPLKQKSTKKKFNNKGRYRKRKRSI